MPKRQAGWTCLLLIREARNCRGDAWGRACRSTAVTLGAMLNEAALEAMDARSRAASPGPWTAFVEGRDHLGGDDFIRVSELDDEPDMYVSRSTSEGLRPASAADLDFIAWAARTYRCS